MTTGNADRLQQQIERVLALMLPRVITGQLALFATWEYRVTAVTPATGTGTPTMVSGVAVSPSCPWPTLANIALWQNSSGLTCIPAIGSIVGVAFHDASASKPVVRDIDPTVVAAPAPAPVPGAKASAVSIMANLLNGLVPGISTALQPFL